MSRGMSDPAVRELAPLILFGAADRHNFGDLLLARIAEAEAGRPVIHAGLAMRDLSAYGGVPVVALGELARSWPERYGNAPADLLHIGGEILDCDAWSAAVMLCADAQADDVVRRLDGRPEAADWAAQQLAAGVGSPGRGRGDCSPGGAPGGEQHGLAGEAGAPWVPYLARRALFAHPGTWRVRAVGGVGLARRPWAFRRAVAEGLRGMASVTVRDVHTRDALAELGIATTLEVDPVVRVTRCFGAQIAARRASSPLAELARALPAGYVAVQFGGEFADDASLRRVAQALAGLPAEWGVVFFRAGATPWHDRDAVYLRLIESFLSGAGQGVPRAARLFPSLDVFDIAALIAGARQVLATSLHVGIVARAGAVPFEHLELGGTADAKWQAWSGTWPGLAG